MILIRGPGLDLFYFPYALPPMPAPDAISPLQLGRFTLDPLRNLLSDGGRDVQLTPLATRLLQLLATKPGEIFGRGAIIDALWRGDWLVGDPALNRLVSEIRRAAGDDRGAPRLIQTVPRQGYRLVASVPVERQAALTDGPSQVREVWRLANSSLLIIAGGLSVLLALAILARLFR